MSTPRGMTLASVVAGAAVIAIGGARLYPIPYPFLGVLPVAALVGIGGATAFTPERPRAFLSFIGALAAGVATVIGWVVAYSDWGYYGSKSDPWFFGCVVAAGVGGSMALARPRARPWRVSSAFAGGVGGAFVAWASIWIAALASWDLPY
jgi:hypothetical protein